ncbi:MAG: hypothetical protein K6A63_01685 [Acholeplasmatales bacterium]|nr:hypothetical protein [Acholeplasmatales bacterium]
MKRKVKMRKLILTLSTIGLLALTTTTSTYAWFKINSTASVEGFDFEVIGGKGFMVSVDGGTYTNDLSTEQIQKAMLVSMNSGKYELGYESDDTGAITKSNVLYEISYEHGKKVRTEVDDEDELLEKAMNALQLAPVTSSNGRDFKNLVGVSQSASGGNYAEFGVYFKSTSSNKADKLKYDIYLDGYGGLDNDGNKVLPTTFTSATTDVLLNADMNAVIIDADGNKSLPYTPGDTHDSTYIADGSKTITVYSTNAARISTTVGIREDVEAEYVLTSDVTFLDKTYYVTDDNETYTEAQVTFGEDVPENTYYEYIEAYTQYNVDTDSSLIYEINDTTNGKYDLGSYATDYDHTRSDYNLEDYYLYSSECNAMFTYYNNLRRSAQISPISYDTALPKTIKSLPTVSSDDKTLTYDKIVQVESGGDEKLVTFRLWLEGWDADCFDGLSNEIKVRLALGSKRVN